MGAPRLAFRAVDQLGWPRTPARIRLGAYSAHGQSGELVGGLASLRRIRCRRNDLTGSLLELRVFGVIVCFHLLDTIPLPGFIRDRVFLQNREREIQ